MVPEIPSPPPGGRPRLRVGRTLGRTLYIVTPGEDRLADRCIGIVDTPELAAMIVAAVNGEPEQSRAAPRIRKREQVMAKQLMCGALADALTTGTWGPDQTRLYVTVPQEPEAAHLILSSDLLPGLRFRATVTVEQD